MTVDFAPDSAPVRLDRDGYCIIRGLVSPNRIDAIDSSLDYDFAATPYCVGDFFGERTKRFGRLLTRAPATRQLVMHPAILGLAEAVLGPGCDRITLNLTQAIEIHPGALAQYPHRDHDLWPIAKGDQQFQVNVMWPLTSFTKENGATLLWPGSHLGDGATDLSEAAASVAVCEPGDALVWLGGTLHGAGANNSDEQRRGIIVSYCLGWLKPFELQWLVYPPEVARHFDPDLAALVGYAQHRPNLGNVEGRCPSVLLAGDRPEHVAAVDALRPDQADALRAHIAAQRATDADNADD